MSQQAIEPLGSRLVYENRWMRLREDQVRFPGGHEGIYSVVEKPDFSTIIPVHADGKIQLVRQHRYPVGGRYWELPQGSCEEDETINPRVLAQKELAEETGLIAGKMDRIGVIFTAYGFLAQSCHIFVARAFTHGEPEREATEQDMETDAFTLDAILQMIAGGDIKDSTTIAALGYWQMTGAK